MKEPFQYCPSFEAEINRQNCNKTYYSRKVTAIFRESFNRYGGFFVVRGRSETRKCERMQFIWTILENDCIYMETFSCVCREQNDNFDTSVALENTPKKKKKKKLCRISYFIILRCMKTYLISWSRNSYTKVNITVPKSVRTYLITKIRMGFF